MAAPHAWHRERIGRGSQPPDDLRVKLRARCRLSAEQLIYRGRAEGWLVVATLESSGRP